MTGIDWGGSPKSRYISSDQVTTSPAMFQSQLPARDLLRLGEHRPRLSQPGLRRGPLGEDRAEDEHRHGDAGEQPLENLDDDRRAPVGDRGGAVDRARDGDRRNDEVPTHRAVLSEAKRRPHEEREEEVRVTPEAAEKHERADADEQGENRDSLGDSQASETSKRCREPHQQQRRHDQRAHPVADPPEQPVRGVVGSLDVAREPERRDAVRGAHRRARDGGEQDQREHVADAIERRPEADASEQRRTDERLERVADRDRRRFRDRSAARRVRDQRADGDRRPEAEASEHEGGERDPGRRPDRSDESLRDGELDPELGRAEVRACDSDEEERVAGARREAKARQRTAPRRFLDHPWNTHGCLLRP